MKQDSPDSLTFELMDTLLDDYAKEEQSKGPGPWERWSFAIGLLGAGVGLLIGTLLGNATGPFVVKVGLAVEISGFAISLLLMVIREWRSFRHARRTYAIELDHDYGYYRALVDKLRAFPLEQREARLRYVRDRKQVMHYRMGLFTGGVEKLGIIPLLVGLYLQFKDLDGDWSSLQQINAVQGLLIWALFLCYAVGWHMVRLKSRVDAYELLLAEANCRS